MQSLQPADNIQTSISLKNPYFLKRNFYQLFLWTRKMQFRLTVNNFLPFFRKLLIENQKRIKRLDFFNAGFFFIIFFVKHGSQFWKSVKFVAQNVRMFHVNPLQLVKFELFFQTNSFCRNLPLDTYNGLLTTLKTNFDKIRGILQSLFDNDEKKTCLFKKKKFSVENSPEHEERKIEHSTDQSSPKVEGSFSQSFTSIRNLVFSKYYPLMCCSGHVKGSFDYPVKNFCHTCPKNLFKIRKSMKRISF